LCESNNLKWNTGLVEAVSYSNSSLYHSIKHTILNPDQITLSPTSGFHHATPSKGGGFCTFSGQVIAALKIFKEFQISGAFLDLDGHFGNSIEDSRQYCPELNYAIPKGCNINPQGTGREYLAHFRTQLKDLYQRVMDYEIGYVVFCHGADSHIDDDRGGQCSTAEWIECSKLFYEWLRDVDTTRGQPLPCSLALFGGYRKDNYDEVLGLHLADLEQCLRIACRRDVVRRSMKPS
jgi:acetoin utilization deacetylase AcuC-like enzyme